METFYIVNVLVLQVANPNQFLEHLMNPTQIQSGMIFVHRTRNGISPEYSRVEPPYKYINMNLEP